MTFLEQLDQDMVDNHFRLSEFGELATYIPATGSAVQIPAIYDEPALSENSENKSIGSNPYSPASEDKKPLSFPKITELYFRSFLRTELSQMSALFSHSNSQSTSGFSNAFFKDSILSQSLPK